MSTPVKIALGMVVDPATGQAVTERIVPLFVSQMMPTWFGYVFMLSLLAAAMSTLSGQFHTTGTAISYDIYEQNLAQKKLEHQATVVDRTVRESWLLW